MRDHGVELDAWQADVLEGGMGVDQEGKWSAFEAAVNVARQNGKGEILLSRVAYGLFELGERLTIWSSHQTDTSMEAFYRLVGFIEDNEDLTRLVARNGIRYANGTEGVKLVDGRRIRFMTRSKSRARGWTCDVLVLDEAMFLAEFSHGAMLPTLSATPNPQVWYAGSAVDQEIHEQGIVFSRVRERGHAGGAKSLAYFEWSVDADGPLALDDEQLDSPEVWATANPALGVRISAEHVSHERAAMDARTFAVERLGVGDWPRTDHVAEGVITAEEWAALCDPDSVMGDPVVFAFDVSPDRRASIAAAGSREDGLYHVEVVRNQAGTAWVIPALLELRERWEPAAIVCDGYGAESLLAQAEEAGLDVTPTSAAQLVMACGRFLDETREQGFRHLGSGELGEAVKAARTRPLGDAGWAWSRRGSLVDISPLVAATLALDAAMDAPGGDVVIF
jgi:hypothetical protein